MPISDDEKFEHSLKEFRPLAAEPLQTEEHTVAPRHRVMVMSWTAACAAVLALTLLLLSQRAKPPQAADENQGHSGAQPPANYQQLTLGRANSLLTHAESYKSAVDQVSSRSQDARQEGKTSALGVLAKENNKL